VLLPRFIPLREWTPRNDAQRRYWTVQYPSTALFPMQALVDNVRRRDVRGYDVPTLVFLHDGDEVVDASRTHEWLGRLERSSQSSVALVRMLPTAGEDGHVLAGRIVAPSQTATVRNRIVQFVR
jgi:esterase/lipase